jgi:hypothetical protein
MNVDKACFGASEFDTLVCFVAVCHVNVRLWKCDVLGCEGYHGLC